MEKRRPNFARTQKSGGEVRDLGQPQAELPSGRVREYLWKRLLLAADLLGWDDRKLDEWRPYYFGADGDAGYPIAHLERVLKGFETRAISKWSGQGRSRKKMTW